MKDTPTVTDKSFIQTIGWKSFAAFSEERDVVIPSAFYHEIFRNTAQKRRLALTAFSEFQRIDIPTQLRFETRFGRATIPLTPRRKVFNPKVVSEEWTPNPNELDTISKYQSEIVEPQRIFWESVLELGVIGFSDAEMRIARFSDEKSFVALCETLTDKARIRAMAVELSYRHADILDESWIHYRLYQAKALHGLILCRRFPSPNQKRGPDFRINLEHDIHDIQYLVLGLLLGSLATNETKKFGMGWRFKLLAPRGELINKETLALVS